MAVAPSSPPRAFRPPPPRSLQALRLSPCVAPAPARGPSPAPAADKNGASGPLSVGGPISVGGLISADVGKDIKGSTKPVDRSKGLWTRCDKCGVILYIKHLKEHHHICFGCNYHLRMTSAERIDHLIDPGAAAGRARTAHRESRQ